MKTDYLKFILLFGFGYILRLMLLLLVIGLMTGCTEEDIPGKNHKHESHHQASAGDIQIQHEG